MQYLRQSTASQEISLGYFLDSTDGDTAETGLTIANTDIDIRKGGGTTIIDKNSGGATHISAGIYSAVLDATDTNTLGMLEVYVHVAGALAVKSVYTVLTATAYDALLTGTFNNLGGVAQTADHTAAIAAIPLTAMRGTDSAATEAKQDIIDTNIDSILLDTAEIGAAGAGLTNINLPNQTMDITGNLTGNITGSVGSVTGGATSTAQTTAQNDLDIITGVSGVNLLTATQASIDAIETDTSTTLDNKINDIQGATFSTSTDSLEAIRNRGDSAWTTGAGGSSPTVEQIRTEMDDNSTQLAAIVLDTNDLQTNQGSWLTATGFNVGKTGYTLTTQDWNTVTPLDAAATRSALGLSTANMDVQFAASVTATGFATPTNITAGTIASVTNKVSADIDSINGVTITGNGSSTPFDV